MSVAPSVNQTVKLIQVSDCHLGADDSFTLAGINTARSLQQVLDDVGKRRREYPRLVVTGDIAAEGEPGAYQLFQSLMDGMPPFSWLPGNHDDFQLMQHSLAQPFCRVVVLEGWALVFLVTAVPGRVGGELMSPELKALEQSLEDYQDCHIALFLHHPPAEIHSRWLDKQRIANHADLADLLGRFENVRAIFCGHVHQQCEVLWQGLPVYSVPSTCFQFSPGSDEFEFCDRSPGYRWIHLLPDGSIETGVEYVALAGQQVDRRYVSY